MMPRGNGTRLLILAGLVILAGAGAGRCRDARAGESRPAGSAVVAADSTAIRPELIVYYFHTTYRCASCRKLEAYAKEAVDTGFADGLKSGRVEWRVINIETKGNEHFVKDYELYTKAVVLVDPRPGRGGRWKNLEKIWQLLGDREKFIGYVQQETRLFAEVGQ